MRSYIQHLKTGNLRIITYNPIQLHLSKLGTARCLVYEIVSNGSLRDRLGRKGKNTISYMAST